MSADALEYPDFPEEPADDPQFMARLNFEVAVKLLHRQTARFDAARARARRAADDQAAEKLRLEAAIRLVEATAYALADVGR